MDEAKEQCSSSRLHPHSALHILILKQIIILLQECASFCFWSPAEVPRMQGSAGFCSLVAIFHDLEHQTFANLWQSCQILVLLCTSFSVFFFVPSTSKSSAFTGPLSSSILSTCPNYRNLFFHDLEHQSSGSHVKF